MNREQKLIEEIAQIDAATKAVNDFIRENFGTGELSPENERAKEEAIRLLGVNYVGPDVLGRLLYNDENKFPSVELDFVKLKEILNEPDEWEEGKKKFKTYALVYVPPISFLELRQRANEAAKRLEKTPVFWEDQPEFVDLMEEPFVHEVPETGRYELVRRDAVPGSAQGDFETQKELITPYSSLSVATFHALAAMMVGQYLDSDLKIYDGEFYYGRTVSETARRSPLILGLLHDAGASVLDISLADDSIRLAVSRNLTECLRGSA